MVLYIENLKDAIKRLLETINKYSKVVGYTIRVQKSAFLYTNNKISGKYKTIPFAIATKRIKYQGINLTKDVKELCPENYKALLKEIEKDTRKWKDIVCSWIRRINIVKWPYYPKQYTDLMQSPSKSQ